MSIEEFMSEIEDKFQDEILSNATEVTADHLGLDIRAGYVLWVTAERDAIICPSNNVRALEYYGGFEYIERDAVRQIGNYTIYLLQEEDDRVGECMDHFETMMAGAE